MKAGGDATRALLAVFRGYAGRRLWLAGALVLAAAVLEGAGVLLLVPLVLLVIGGDETGWAGAAATGLFEAAGVESVTGRMSLGLALFLLVVLARAALDVWRSREMIAMATGFVVALRARMFGVLSRAPWRAVAALDREGAGHSLSVDLDRASGFVWAFWSALLAAVSLAVYSILALAMAPGMTLLALALGGGLFLALRPLRRRAARLGAELSEADGALFGQTGRFLAGLKPARAHRNAPEFARRAIAAAERVARRNAALRMDLALGGIAMQTAVAVAAAMLVLLAVVATDTSAAALVAMLLILVRVFRPFQSLQHAMQDMTAAAAAFAAAEARQREIARAAEAEPETAAPPLLAAPELRLEQASLRAKQGPILHEVCCHVPAGRVSLIAGLSGAGKTTLCDLLTGLVEPDAGRLLIDGRPADAASRAGLGKALAYVGQEPFLIERTVRENLAWGARVAAGDDAAMFRALAAVGAETLIRNLPDGLDTPVRADAARFSGGERQRLRLARALLRHPLLLVLDEATSALDIEAENRVIGGLREALPGATVVLVSHRPAALGHADHVIWLEGGRVVEEGACAGLLADAESRTARWRALARA